MAAGRRVRSPDETIYCPRDMRQAEREAVRAAIEAVRRRWAAPR
jgi:hypothetical protein